MRETARGGSFGGSNQNFDGGKSTNSPRTLSFDLQLKDQTKKFQVKLNNQFKQVFGSENERKELERREHMLTTNRYNSIKNPYNQGVLINNAYVKNLQKPVKHHHKKSTRLGVSSDDGMIKKDRLSEMSGIYSSQSKTAGVTLDASAASPRNSNKNGGCLADELLQSRQGAIAAAQQVSRTLQNSPHRFSQAVHHADDEFNSPRRRNIVLQGHVKRSGGTNYHTRDLCQYPFLNYGNGANIGQVGVTKRRSSQRVGTNKQQQPESILKHTEEKQLATCPSTTKKQFMTIGNKSTTNSSRN